MWCSTPTYDSIPRILLTSRLARSLPFSLSSLVSLCPPPPPPPHLFVSWLGCLIFMLDSSNSGSSARRHSRVDPRTILNRQNLKGWVFYHSCIQAKHREKQPTYVLQGYSVGWNAQKVGNSSRTSGKVRRLLGSSRISFLTRTTCKPRALFSPTYYKFTAQRATRFKLFRLGIDTYVHRPKSICLFAGHGEGRCGAGNACLSDMRVAEEEDLEPRWERLLLERFHVLWFAGAA